MQTNQEIFTTIKNHLLQQNLVSKEYRLCYLKNSHGLKCAIGCLIPDDLYSPSLEMNGGLDTNQELVNILESIGIQLRDPNFSYLNKTLTYKMLLELQSIHDNLDPQYWSNALANIAIKYNLNYN